MRLVIYVYVGAGANAHSCVRMHMYMFKAWTGEVGPLCLSVPSFLPSHNPPCLSIPPTSRLSFTLSPLPTRPFFHSFSFYLSTTRGVSFLPLVLSERSAFQR